MGATIPISTQPNGTVAPRLLDTLRDKRSLKHYSLSTAQRYVNWVQRFVRFHDHDLPRDMQVRRDHGIFGHERGWQCVLVATGNVSNLRGDAMYRDHRDDLPPRPAMKRAAAD